MAGVPRPCDVDGHGEGEAAVSEPAGLREAAQRVIDHYIGKDASVPMLTWGDIAALEAALAASPTAAPTDPHSPPWEACKVCGGDHWTKDHPAVVAALAGSEPAAGLREAAEPHDTSIVFVSERSFALHAPGKIAYHLPRYPYHQKTRCGMVICDNGRTVDTPLVSVRRDVASRVARPCGKCGAD